MSVLAKARTYERGFPWFVFDAFTQYQQQGPDYIASLLQGYREKPANVTLPSAPTTTSTSPAMRSACRRR